LRSDSRIEFIFRPFLRDTGGLRARARAMKVLAAFLVNTMFNFAIGLLVALFLGPDQFGRFALAMAVGMVVQTVAYEWIRLAAIRFYSERTREEQPELRATLDFAFALVSVGLGAVAIMFILGGLTFSLSHTLLALAFTAAIANGLFDYNTALVRARFQDGLYGRLVITKNVVALLLTVGGAFFFKSAVMTLAGACVSMASSVILARAALHDANASPRLARRSLAYEYAQYSVPIVAANVLYLAIPLANRTLITSHLGFAETGHFSLAYDIGTRLIAAVGSALDVLLFQIAVRAERTHGSAEAQEQVARNMATVFAILLPAAAGLWLILPSIEALIVPQAFRGPFGHYLTLLLPGLLCFGFMNFAINAFFQIGKRTMPLIAAAVLACTLNALLLVTLPRGSDASHFALAQTGAFASALVALTIFAASAGAKWPKLRDILLTITATVAMCAAVWPMRAWTPGVLTCIIQVTAGGAIFAAFAAAFNIAGLRSSILSAWRGRRG
jgi:O-antigen/teichoic acid export membrane protein